MNFTIYYRSKRAASWIVAICLSLCLGGENSGDARITEKKCWSCASLGLLLKWERNRCIIAALEGLPAISFAFSTRSMKLSSSGWDESSSPSSGLSFADDDLLLLLLELLLLLQQGSLLLKLLWESFSRCLQSPSSFSMWSGRLLKSV